MTETERVETPEVSFSLSGGELMLRDEAGGGEVQVEVDGDTSLTPASEDWFDVPMDGAVSLETESLRVPHNTAVWLRDVDGENYGMLTKQETTVNGKGTFVDISASMKVVAYVEGGPIRGHIHRESGRVDAVVGFDQPTRVILGARSIHEKPTATITVPADPASLMEAVSHLGTSMKEWSAERSWPTLRGHPPEIRIGEQLNIPDRLSVPDTGVSVAVPPKPASVLRVAPVAHYFGADVVPGERPELRICEYAEPLGTGRELERSVTELVARGLVLDSLVRIGGYYSIPRHEYDELAPELPFYPPELYDEPVGNQLLEYLEVPFDEIKPYVPLWPVTATVRPSVSEAEALPYLLNTLSRIHVSEDASPPQDSELPSMADVSTKPNVPHGTAWLPPAGRRAAMEYQRRHQERADVLIIGHGPPPESCFTRTSWEYHDWNDTCVIPEYRESVTQAELTTVLQESPLYVHYGNQVTSEGFICSDGLVPFDKLPSAAIGTVSFTWEDADTEPIAELLDTSVTACLLDSSIAREAAEALGKYLILGFPVAQAVRFSGLEAPVRFLGDPSLSVADRSHGAYPAVFDVEPTGDGTFQVSFIGGNTRPDTLGSYGHPSPDEYGGRIPLNGNAKSLGSFSTEEVVALTEEDQLLWVHGNVPDAVPQESVVRASRLTETPERTEVRTRFARRLSEQSSRR